VKRKLLIFAGLVLFTIIIGLCLVDKEQYGDFLTHQITLATENSGVNLSFGSSKIHILGLHVDTLGGLLRKSFIHFKLKNVEFDISLLRFLIFSAAASLQADAYSGKILGECSYGLFSNSGNASLRVVDLALADHPQVNGFGITSGKLGIDIGDITFSRKQGFEHLSGIVNLIDVNKPSSTTLSARITGAPLDITLPKFSNLSLTSTVTLNSSELNIPSFKLSSSLGSLLGSFQSNLRRSGRLGKIEGRVQVRLTDSGSEFFGSFLTLVGRGVIDSSSKNFTINLSGLATRPVYSFVAE